MHSDVAEVLGIHVPMGISVCRRHVVGDRSPHGDFDTLQRIHHEQAKSPVEHIEVEHVVERGSVAEQMVCPWTPEWNRAWR
ncbi:hypothetical protein PLANTIT3_20030 [Plantibacter sp. T3]|nr:hypothetical protein PLANTIT3_20030 [Plantibacter sp. T3]